MSETIAAEDARRLIATGEATVVDFRDDEAWRENRIAGAIRLSRSNFDRELGEVAEDVQLVVIASEDQGPALADRLSEHGREAAYLEGGLDAWKNQGFPVQPSDDPEEDAVV